MDREIIALKNALDKAANIAVLGGAGFSTESGIPDFRSRDGIYNKYRDRDPEALLSAETLLHNPELFFDFYVDIMIIEDVKPNTAHYYLAELEKKPGKHVTIITQNIDGLHQEAGSRNVIELHGSAKRYYCVGCGEKYDVRKMDKTKFTGKPPLPRCDKCGCMVRPDVVLFQESLNVRNLKRAAAELERADLVIVGGTSLAVYPANMLLTHAQFADIFVINRDPVNISRFVGDQKVTVIQESLGKVFGGLKALEKSGSGNS